MKYLPIYLLSITTLPLLTAAPATAENWPTHARDASRSNVTPDQLSLPLKPSWTWRSHTSPKPAWGGPAKEDLYNRPGVLKPRVQFDRVFQVAVVDGRIYFGSSVDDKLYCLDAATGQEVWSYYSEGPIRLAPYVADGRVYFGSDDGHVYCLGAAAGQLVWRKRLGPTNRRVPGNGRIISVWPVRTGVIGFGDAIYAGCGVFPSEGVYLTALDPKTGEVNWRQTLQDLPIQGYLLASQTRLYAPTGRNNPTVFERLTGKRLHTVRGQGGTYCLITNDQLVFGPGKTGQLGLVDANQTDQIATFAGNHMVVAPPSHPINGVAGMSYLHTDTQLSALNRTRYLQLIRAKKTLAGRINQLKQALKQLGANGAADVIGKLRDQLAATSQQFDQANRELAACLKWTVPCGEPMSLILAGDLLITGGDNAVAAYNALDGAQSWRTKVEGGAYGLAVADQRLYVSTDRGVIHCLTGDADSQPNSTTHAK